MPFDTTQLPATPSLPLFIEILEQGIHHPLWPVGFCWNYRHCGTCAMGLAHRLWPTHFRADESVYRYAEIFNLPHNVIQAAFWDAAITRRIPSNQVLSYEVAWILKNV